MARMVKAEPTEFELEILKVLWKRGRSTAREVLDAIAPRRAVGYTTVLKMLQIMEGKGMVVVDRAERSHVYEAALAETKTLARLARTFVDRAFDGAVDKMLVHLVKGGGLSGAGLKDLEQRIAALRREEGGRRE